MKGGFNMSLTIAYIAMPPKSQEVSHIQAAEQTKLNNEQQQVAMTFQQEVRHESETTIRRKDVDNEELRNEERKKGKQKKKMQTRTSKKDKTEENEEKQAVNPLQGRLFDMKV